MQQSGVHAEADASPHSVTCVDVLQAAQHLVQEELMVLRRQVIVGLDDLCISKITGESGH